MNKAVFDKLTPEDQRSQAARRRALPSSASSGCQGEGVAWRRSKRPARRSPPPTSRGSSSDEAVYKALSPMRSLKKMVEDRSARWQ
ncbi:hypothetical protein F2981_22230 (plasmid) [Sinorhizobium meliloti]|nr:hypothetical protein [Sinorhizobium meliloti]